MKITLKNQNEIPYLQQGGAAPEAAPVEEAPAAPEQGGDPMEQILQAAAQAVQTQDGQLALQVCEALVEMAGGSAPTPEQAPGQPVYRRGGRLVRWEKRN